MRNAWRGLLFFGLLMSSAVLSGDAAGATVGVPPELARIIAANSQSLSAGASASGDFTRMYVTPVEPSIASGVEVLEGGTRVTTYVSKESTKFWASGRNTRTDIHYLGTPDPIRGDIGAETVKAHLADPSRASMSGEYRRVRTVEATLSYISGRDFFNKEEDRYANVSKGDPDSPYGRDAIGFYKYAVTWSGRTLEDFVGWNAEHGYLPEVSRVDLDGEECFLIDYEYPTGNSQKIWVVPSKGMMIRKGECAAGGKVFYEWTSELKEYAGGVFWVGETVERQWNGANLASYSHLKVNDVQFGIPIDDSLFTIAALGIPAGTEVSDKKLRWKYSYGMPFSLDESYVDDVLASTAEPLGEDAPVWERAPRTTDASGPETGEPGRRRTELPWLWWLGGAVIAAGLVSVALYRRRSRNGRG